MKNALADTGLWYAMFDEKDAYYNKEISRQLENFKIITPYPTLYETLRTRFVRKKLALKQFEEFLQSDNIEYFDDNLYRDDARKVSFDWSLKFHRPISMIDCLLRLIIEDRNNRIDCLLTVNLKDFIDVCQKRQIEILDIAQKNIKAG